MSRKPKKISFPRDNQAHRSIIEWWYFNGHLRNKTGKHYSFMDCLFKIDPKRAKIPLVSKILLKERLITIPYIYFAHSVITDLTKQKNYKKIQYVSLVSHNSFRQPLLFINYADPTAISGYTNCEIVETSQFNFHLKSENLDLQLKSNKKPLLEGGHGYIKPCNRRYYYYSLTDLYAKGTVAVNKKIIEVEGRGWMDHQWANIAYNYSHMDKWSWFSLKLENGLDIMLFEYDDCLHKEYQADMINAGGRQEHFKKALLTPGKDIWHSKKTKAKYPLSWTIEIPNKKIRLNIHSLKLDQEMIFNTINYWEAPLTVRGTMSGKEVKGLGFIELVGYPSDYNFLILATKDINKKIQKELRKSRKKIFRKIKRKLPKITHLTKKEGLKWTSRLHRLE